MCSQFPEIPSDWSDWPSGAQIPRVELLQPNLETGLDLFLSRLDLPLQLNWILCLFYFLMVKNLLNQTSYICKVVKHFTVENSVLCLPLRSQNFYILYVGIKSHSAQLCILDLYVKLVWWWWCFSTATKGFLLLNYILHLGEYFQFNRILIKHWG